jgi:hypothetical protein
LLTKRELEEKSAVGAILVRIEAQYFELSEVLNILLNPGADLVVA